MSNILENSFGVCCIFLVSASGGTITQNCTYIQNPGFPSVYGATTAVSYTIQKCAPGITRLDYYFFWLQTINELFNCIDICCVRLDFESFTLRTPADTIETNGGACTDTFMVTVLPICFYYHYNWIFVLWITTISSSSTTPIPTICGLNTGQHSNEIITYFMITHFISSIALHLQFMLIWEI